MPNTFKVIVENYDENGILQGRNEIISRSISAPKHIKDVGLNHKEQIELLKNILDNLLPNQFNLIENEKKCQQCNGNLQKNGFVSFSYCIYRP